MVDYSLDATFQALSDPSRRRMLAALTQGEQTILALAKPLAMTLPGAAKHVAVLEKAGLIARRKQGRTHICTLLPEPLAQAEQWLQQWSQFWGGKLDALEQALATPETSADSNAPLRVSLKRDFAVSPQRVFDAWLDPALAARFLFATPKGRNMLCEIDAKVGGLGVIVMRRDGDYFRHVLRYDVIERPHWLAFRFAVNPAEDADERAWPRVDIAVEAIEGGSRLTLVQALNPESTAHADKARRGWSMILENLATLLEGRND